MLKSMMGLQFVHLDPLEGRWSSEPSEELKVKTVAAASLWSLHYIQPTCSLTRAMEYREELCVV